MKPDRWRCFGGASFSFSWERIMARLYLTAREYERCSNANAANAVSALLSQCLLKTQGADNRSKAIRSMIYRAVCRLDEIAFAPKNDAG